MTDKDAAVELSAEDEAYFASEGEAETAQEQDNGQEVRQAGQAEAEGLDAGQKEEPEGQARDEKGRFVPHQALHAEREEHKKTRAELQELRDFRARMEERMRIAQEARQAQQPKQPDVILDENDPNFDLFKAYRYTVEQLNGINQRFKSQEEAQQRQTQAAEMENKIWSYWDADSRAYAQQNPDFGNAAKWLSDVRDKQLQALSAVDDSFSTPAGRNKQINDELKAIVAQATRQGRSAAEIVYSLAKGYGYQPGAGKPLEMPEKLEKVDQARAASRGVGQASGRAANGELTLEQIDAMTPAEFETFMSDPKNAAYFDKLMGA